MDDEVICVEAEMMSECSRLRGCPEIMHLKGSRPLGVQGNMRSECDAIECCVREREKVRV